MQWKKWPSWMIGGLLLGIPASTYMFYYLFTQEYLGCSPRWESMCGTGIAIVGLIYGLGISVLPVYVVGLATESLGLGKDTSYLLALTALSLGTFVTYFLIGSLIGFLHGRLSQRKRYIFWGIVTAIIVWIAFRFFHGNMVDVLYSIREKNATPVDINHPDEGMILPCGPICTVVQSALEFISNPLSLVVFVGIGAFSGWLWRACREV